MSEKWWWWAIPFGFVLGAGIAVGAFYAEPRFPDKTSAKCDEAVATMLHTKDPVELRRAIFLIKWFNCGVARRLP
jgi:hypothetical protein